MKKQTRDKLQHRLNPLHVFCALRKAGVRAKTARKLCAAYERCVYRHVLS